MGLSAESKVKMTNKFKKGRNNLITDVPGVKVGQVTLEDSQKHIHTGVTAILPHEGNVFKEKVAAATAIINGFGKTEGLVQIEELGTMESPIVLTNTLSVGTALETLVKYMLKDNPEIGTTTGTVNCVVAECNDGELNDIRGQHVKPEHVMQALTETGDIFEEGAVGAGRGMICMGLKGGIGSASRILTIDEKDYTIGALVLTNFGMFGNLRIDGKLVDVSSVADKEKPANANEKGSVIIVIGTDIPLSDRQLRRVARRSAVSLARVGSFLGNGSGDIAIAFSNGNLVPHDSKESILETKMLHEDKIDKIFEATAEVVEEAVYSSLDHAELVQGIRGKVVHALSECI